MPGPIGATSGKFVMMGAALLLHGRIAGSDVRMAIMPGAPTSAITASLAKRVPKYHGDADVTVHLRAETFRARIATIEPDIGTDADVRLGQDVLAGNPIDVDFQHHALQPLSPSEARRLQSKSRPIAIRHEADDTLSVDVEVDGKPAMPARLDLAAPVGFATPDAVSGKDVRVGGVSLHDVSIVPGDTPVVGLYAFRRMRVIFDLGHDRLWVRS